MKNNDLIQTIGGVWNEQPHWPVLYWGTGVAEGVKWLELIADDWTYTFKTTGQKFSALNLNLPYGPIKNVRLQDMIVSIQERGNT
jgi:hypothetical protein